MNSLFIINKGCASIVLQNAVTELINVLTTYASPGFNIQACTTLDVPPELSEWVENLLVSPAPSKEVHITTFTLISSPFSTKSLA